ncbi:hypothetical protein WJX81_004766 [Elliptochloris bilobata]|uniref:Chalcone isomerase domain-containing protein n=1 Tax=Elliptochloris bilobata TaxID=381761 RepID=A0AAW1RNR3_9CHLO
MFRTSEDCKVTAEKEAKTGTQFPGTFCHLRKKDCPSIVGVGARAKRLLGVKNVDVYALGLYVDSAAVKEKVAPKYRDQAPGALSDSQQLLDEVACCNEVEKTLRIVVTSGLVNQSRFTKGIRESLTQPLQKAGALQPLDDFEARFAGAEFHKGMEVAFSNTRSGGLALRIGGKDAGVVDSQKFTDAFFGLYMGADPVSKDGRSSIARGLATLVAQP